jgi:hypothetical protein
MNKISSNQKIFIYFMLIFLWLVFTNPYILLEEYPNLCKPSFFTYFPSFLYKITIVGLIYEMDKKKLGYKKILLVIFILEILPYHLNYLTSNIYFNFFAIEKKMQIEALSDVQQKGGMLDMLPTYISPLEYHPLFSIVIEPLKILYKIIISRNFFSLLVYLTNHPVFLLVIYKLVNIIKRKHITH